MNMNAMWLRCASRFEGWRAGGIVVVPLLAVLFAGGCTATKQVQGGTDAGTENTQAANDAASEREKNRALCRKGLELVNAGVIPALTLLMNKECAASSSAGIEHGAEQETPAERQRGGYLRSWMLDVPGIPPEIIPGAKLGYSKEESARHLRPDVRELLNGVLRILDKPDQYVGRQAIYDALHVKGENRAVFYSKMKDGSRDMGFREKFISDGVFSNPAWNGWYYYDGQNGPSRRGWGVRVEIDIKTEMDCIDSRAVEGYLDLHINPRIIEQIHPISRERWNRHGPGGHTVYAKTMNSSAGLRLVFADGCWSFLNFTHIYPEEIFKDAKIFHR
ncbi:hypothetical protein [Cupriavidus basilensis]|uniref:hypothetical protein n=1 Tax=Cupriavidus basilensis TaxID=68895 RepID=UPI0020A6D526|nr:hypothetical protein [Cupriavidus basilensis]MCP3022358.1 hypothetical protein [Cupriavidus basilensis]